MGADLDVAAHAAGREDEEMFLSVVTASELLHGVHRAHARLWAELASRGELIGAHDLWLAANCVGRGLSLATGSLREFGRVPGLVVEDWSGGEREA